MPPIKLYLRPPRGAPVIWFQRPGGVTDSLLALRLVAFANLRRDLTPSPGMNKYGLTECVVDTGAYFSLISESLWSLFRPGFVTPLPFDPRTPPALRSLNVAGGAYPYTLGELTVRFQDLDLNVLSLTLIAKLTRDGGRLRVPFLLGLRGGFFDGRVVRADPDSLAPFG